MHTGNKNENRREIFVLGIYTLYTVFLIVAAVVFDWQKKIIPISAFCVLACIGLFLKKYKSYFFRATVTALMLWIAMSVYLTRVKSFHTAVAIVISIIVLLAMYGIPKLTYLSLFFITANLLFHFFVLRDISLQTSQAGFEGLLCVVAVYVTLLFTYILVKTQLESNEILMENMSRIKNAEQSKDDFMANVSHEIRTPINTVYGISEMLLNEELPEQVREGIGNIRTAGRQLLSLVSNILDFSELSTGKIEVVSENYNITSTINDVLNMTVANAAGKNIELVIDCAPDIPRGLIGDEQKIRRAVVNILNNAVKFTNEGGILVTISFRQEAYGGNLIVTVEDTGIGMTEEALETLFNKYNQVDSKGNRKNDGLGLGLAITKYIVKSLGGFLTVKSTYGKGTYVRMVFPQKIGVAEPIASVKNPEETTVMVYMDVEQYTKALIRDGYSSCVKHIVEGLHVNYRLLRTFPELKRRVEKERADYLFVGWREYCEDRNYFEALSEQLKVVLILERNHKESVLGSRLLCVYKPFYVLTIASVLNGEYAQSISQLKEAGSRFVAPDVKVLVVDDNLMNLKVIEGLLKPYRLKVYVAESGREALEKAESEHFDIIFMDHMMPEMDGIEAFHRLRQKPGIYFREVPVVALTANAVAGAREMFLREGFADYISKPVELSQLDRVLGKLIPDFRKQRKGDAGKPVEPASGAFAGKPAGTVSGLVTGKPGSAKAEAGEPVEALHVHGLDEKSGMGYYGNRFDIYAEVVRTFVQIAPRMRSDIETAMAGKDYKNYTVYVHSLKSNSYGIGATELGQMAERLETAGKEGDAAAIEAGNGALLEAYKKLVEELSENAVLFPGRGGGAVAGRLETGGVEEDPFALDRGRLVQKLSELGGLLEKYEQDECIQCIDRLKGYRYGGRDLGELLLAVRKKTEEFEYDEAKAVIDELLEKLV